MPVAGSNQAGSRTASASDKRSRPAGPVDQEIAVAGDAAALAGLADGEAREIALGDRIEAVLRQGVEAEHEIAGEALDDGRPVRLEALLLQRGRLRPRAGIAEPDPGRRDHGREDEPVRHLVLGACLRPAEASAADPAAVEEKSAGPLEIAVPAPAGMRRRWRRRARSCRNRRRGARPRGAPPARAPPRIRRGRTAAPRPASPPLPRRRCGRHARRRRPPPVSVTSE